VFVFALVQLAPGDPAALLAGNEALPEDVDAMRKAMGLDKPIHVQLGIWFANILQGDLGKSVISKLPVMDLIIARLTPTLSITILSEFITVVVAVPLGVLAAWKANTWIDRGIMVCLLRVLYTYLLPGIPSYLGIRP
jgi:peptide/nickel transport system permease protein